VCVCVLMLIFFSQFSFLSHYMFLQGNTTWLIQDILINIDF
jgi:hypothetical protein